VVKWCCVLAESITLFWDAETCCVAKRFLRNANYLFVRLHLTKMLPVRLTTFTEHFTCTSDWTYRICYPSVIQHLTKDVTCPSDCTYQRCYPSFRQHLPKVLPVRQTALTEDVTCPSDCTYRSFYLYVRQHLPKIDVACNVNPWRQQYPGIARNMEILAAIKHLWFFFFDFGKEPSNYLKIYHIWSFEYLVSVAARAVNFKLRSCGMWRRLFG
jgi:hypothetical protein